MQVFGWFIVVMIFVTFLAFLGTRAWRRDLSRASFRAPHAPGRPKPDAGPVAHFGADSSASAPSDPNLEHDGRVYFFASIAERDTCSAHLRGLALAQGKAITALRAVH